MNGPLKENDSGLSRAREHLKPSDSKDGIEVFRVHNGLEGRNTSRKRDIVPGFPGRYCSPMCLDSIESTHETKSIQAVLRLHRSSFLDRCGDRVPRHEAPVLTSPRSSQGSILLLSCLPGAAKSPRIRCWITRKIVRAWDRLELLLSMHKQEVVFPAD